MMVTAFIAVFILVHYDANWYWYPILAWAMFCQELFIRDASKPFIRLLEEICYRIKQKKDSE
jgi:hypothetical protein